MIEKHGDEVVLKPAHRPELKTLNDVARYLGEKYPQAADFPDPPERPKHHERPIPEW